MYQVTYLDDDNEHRSATFSTHAAAMRAAGIASIAGYLYIRVWQLIS